MQSVNMDEVWDMGIVSVLNCLSYLKAKEAHEKELIKATTK